jgi:hypothetical protein
MCCCNASENDLKLFFFTNLWAVLDKKNNLEWRDEKEQIKQTKTGVLHGRTHCKEFPRNP